MYQNEGNFVSKTGDFVSKTGNFVFKMMDFADLHVLLDRTEVGCGFRPIFLATYATVVTDIGLFGLFSWHFMRLL